MDTQIPQDDAAATGPVAPPDAWLERRLRVFERALTALEARFEATQREHALTIARMEERIRTLMGENAATQAARETVEGEDVTLAAVNGGTRTIRTVAGHDLEAAISAAPVAEPDIPAHATTDSAGQAVDTAQDDIVDAALALPVRGPVEQGVPRAEMARILNDARQAVRTGEEDAAPGKWPHLKLPRLPARLRWLSLGCLALVGLFLGAGLMLGEPARAVQGPQGMGVAHRHVSPDAFQRMTALADYGDAGAQAGMALAYLRGDQIAEDPRAALHWAGQAAEKGNPIGQYLMGTFYQQDGARQDDVLKADPDRAVRWFKAAAEAGNLKAMHDLGVAYATGRGTKADPQKAAHWFRRAAEHGYVDSAFNLAVLYERGEGVHQSGAQALKWYEVAARAGDTAARKRVSFLRDHIPHAQVAQADQDVRAFVRLTPLPDANRLPAF